MFFNKIHNKNKNFWIKKTVNLNVCEINFGPQHPAAHGVLRLILVIIGELIIQAHAHIGLLHRGTEKLIESKLITESLPYFDRLDYVSMMCNEHAFTMTIEFLLKINISTRSKYIRVLFSEITRILNHIMALTTHAMDVGALTPFLWCFEEREKLLEFYERVSGARIHAAYIRPGGLAEDIPLGLLSDIYIFALHFQGRILEIEELLNNNRIWKQRLTKIGFVSKEQAEQWGFSGVMLRGSGVAFDLRKNEPYEIYSLLNFKIPTSKTGDCLGRYYVRINELKESIKLILQILNKMPLGPVRINETKLMYKSNKNFKLSMENIIHHFKTFSNWINLNFKTKQSYIRIEAPKGEFGTHVILEKTNKIERCRIRAPGFIHLQGLNLMTFKHLIADVVTIIGTQDIVFGEVDR